jgi:hypothetical protein
MEQRSEIVRFGLLEPSRSERKRRWLSRWVGLAAQVILIGLLASVGQLSQPARRFPLQGDYLVLQLPRATPEPRRQLTAKVKPSVSSARVEPRPEAPRPPPLEMPSAKTAAKVPPNPTLPEAPPRIPAPAGSFPAGTAAPLPNRQTASVQLGVFGSNAEPATGPRYDRVARFRLLQIVQRSARSSWLDLG